MMSRKNATRRKTRKIKTTVAANDSGSTKPTAERAAMNDTRSDGMAVRITPVIDTLRDSGKLTAAQYDALNYYREQAHKAEDDAALQSPLSPEKIMSGASGYPTTGTLPVSLLRATAAILETARIERDLGHLRELARAVAVDDITLTRWCIAKHGGRERYGPGGKFVAMVPMCERKVMDMALLELRFAAGWISQ